MSAGANGVPWRSDEDPSVTALETCQPGGVYPAAVKDVLNAAACRQVRPGPPEPQAPVTEDPHPNAAFDTLPGFYGLAYVNCRVAARALRGISHTYAA